MSYYEQLYKFSTNSLNNPKFNSMEDCISITKNIKNIIESIIIGTGLGEQITKYEKKYKFSLDGYFCFGLLAIDRFIKTGLEKDENEINDNLKIIRDMDNNHIPADQKDKIYQLYHLINLLYINAKLCREKMKEFSQNSL